MGFLVLKSIESSLCVCVCVCEIYVLCQVVSYIWHKRVVFDMCFCHVVI